ncbi:MAG: M60 family metallopeptidase [Niabella sp.]
MIKGLLTTKDRCKASLSGKTVSVILAITLFASCGKKSDFGYLQDASTLDKGVDSVHVPVDTSMSNIDRSKYLQASIFPGLVCVEEPRVSRTVNLDLFYVKPDDLRINVLPQAQFSTGFYAAPGELVEITIPDGVYDLSAQIGAWTDYVGSVPNAQRDAIIYSRTKLVPGKNYMRNLYGGHIYILPSQPRAVPLPIGFSNVVESPDFVLGVTDPTAWKQKLTASCVPYLELRSKYVIFTIRRDYALRFPIADPTALMNEWDQGIKEDFFTWTGLEENPSDPKDRSPQLPYRIVLDINITVGYGHDGFPIMAINDTYWQTTITDITKLRQSMVWGLYHEIGHNFQQPKYWSWPAVGETTNNLFIYHLSKRMNDAGRGQWPARHDPDNIVGGPERTVAPALAFAAASGAKDFDNFADPFLADPGNAPFARLVPFLQIFDKIPANWGYPGQGDGWGIMTELYKRSRRALRESSTTLAKHDFLYETVSDYTRRDWQLFFRQWGISLSSTAIARVGDKEYPLMMQEIWKYNPYTRTGGDSFVDIDLYSNSSWTIESFSSQEPTGEGPPNGLASSIIDGNLNTFWHSEWSTGTAEPPHYIVVDLGAVSKVPLPISGFRYSHRAGLARIASKVDIEISDNKSTWTKVAGSPFALAGVNSWQTINFSSPVSARYIKLSYPDRSYISDGTPYLAIGEFEVIK